MVAIPNRRSSHRRPTPVGGGLASVVPVTIAWFVLGLRDDDSVLVTIALTGLALTWLWIRGRPQPREPRHSPRCPSGGSPDHLVNGPWRHGSMGLCPPIAGPDDRWGYMVSQPVQLHGPPGWTGDLRDALRGGGVNGALDVQRRRSHAWDGAGLLGWGDARISAVECPAGPDVHGQHRKHLAWTCGGGVLPARERADVQPLVDLDDSSSLRRHGGGRPAGVHGVAEHPPVTRPDAA